MNDSTKNNTGRICSSGRRAVPSEERARLQEEAISKNADTFRCVKQLQAMTIAETGTKTEVLNLALDCICDAAAYLAGERAGDDINLAREVLRRYSYPDILG